MAHVESIGMMDLLKKHKAQTYMLARMNSVICNQMSMIPIMMRRVQILQNPNCNLLLAFIKNIQCILKVTYMLQAGKMGKFEKHSDNVFKDPFLHSFKRLVVNLLQWLEYQFQQ